MQTTDELQREIKTLIVENLLLQIGAAEIGKDLGISTSFDFFLSICCDSPIQAGHEGAVSEYGAEGCHRMSTGFGGR